MEQTCLTVDRLGTRLVAPSCGCYKCVAQVNHQGTALCILQLTPQYSSTGKCRYQICSSDYWQLPPPLAVIESLPSVCMCIRGVTGTTFFTTALVQRHLCTFNTFLCTTMCVCVHVDNGTCIRASCASSRPTVYH